MDQKRTNSFRIIRLSYFWTWKIRYKARHVLLDQVRAIKFLRPELRERQECIARFHREAQVMVKIKNRHVVTLHEFGTVGNELFFLVMEFLQGESLRKRLRRKSWVPIAEAVRIVQQVALGLVDAHKLGIVHRDISPDNILLVPEEGEEIAKIIDFGIAKNMAARRRQDHANDEARR